MNKLDTLILSLLVEEAKRKMDREQQAQSLEGLLETLFADAPKPKTKAWDTVPAELLEKGNEFCVRLMAATGFDDVEPIHTELMVWHDESKGNDLEHAYVHAVCEMTSHMALVRFGPYKEPNLH